MRQILLVDNMDEFRKIMEKRNNELERKALQLMLENERRQARVIQGQRGGGPANMDNSFSEESGSSEEEEDGSANAMRQAILESQKTEKLDK